MKKRILSFCILLAMLLSFTCCAYTSENEETSAEDGGGETTTEEETVTEIASGVPKDKTYGGTEIKFFNATMEEVLYVEEATGDIINDLIYERNNSIMENLDVKFTFVDEKFDEAVEKIRNFVVAGDQSYDIITSKQYELGKIVCDGILYDMIDLPFIDVKNPWWADQYMEQLNLGDVHRYYVTGDITPGFLRWITSCYYNKVMYNNLFGNPDELYNTVLEGKWTFDKLAELTKDVWVDTNGNSKADFDEEVVAYTVQGAAVSDGLFYNAGGSYIKREDEKTFVRDAVNERNIKIINGLYKVYYENPGACWKGDTWPELNNDVTAKFASDQQFFMFGWLHSAEKLTDMTSDYGIIPYPKLDETMKNYRALIHDEVPLFCLPMTCTETESSAAVLEEMAFFGYKKVAPAYYEMVLKNRYMRDSTDNALKIIDLIHDSTYTDTAFVYTIVVGDVGQLQRMLMYNKSTDLVSEYEKKQKKTEDGLNNLLESYFKE